MIPYKDKKYRHLIAKDLFGLEAERINCLLRLGMFVSEKGYLFIRHRDRNKMKSVFHRYTDIAKALNSQIEIIKDYRGAADNEGEQSFFKNLEADLLKVTSGYDIWKQLDDRSKVNNLNVIANILEVLKNNRLVLKEEIAKLIGKMDSPKDSLDRLNPGAKKAIAVSARRKARKRSKQIDISIELAEKRRLALQIETQYMQKNLLCATIRFGLLNLALKENIPDDLKQQTGQLLYLLQSVWLLPYKEEADKLKKLIHALK